MLHEFLNRYKKEIIQLCRDKALADGQAKPTSTLLDKGLPIFYNELIEVLQRTASASVSESATKDFRSGNVVKVGDAAAHGKESLRLGYSISQVVHFYGAICQAITEFVQTKSFNITTREFQDLNLSLDCAIAEAVSEFEKTQNENFTESEGERLGYLVHEIGNSLAAAAAAHEMIQKGHVGSAGVTSDVLTKSHERMWHLIHSVQAEIRLRGHATVKQTQFPLIDLVNEVEASSKITNKAREVFLTIDVDPLLQLNADRELIFSALSNLVNNGQKFTKKSGKMSVRGKKSGDRVLIEIEDECGGLPEGKAEELFKPFMQKDADKSGMGLGLTLSRQAIESNQGKLTVRNLPGKGCVFTIDLPKSEDLVSTASRLV